MKRAFPYRLSALGGWKWLSLAFLAIPVIFYIVSWRPAQAPETFGTTILGPVVVGGRAVVLGTNAPFPIDAARATTFHVRLCEGCRDQLRSIAIGFGDAAGAKAEALAIVSGDANSLQTTVPAAAPASHLWIELRELGGTVHRHSWRIASR